MTGRIQNSEFRIPEGSASGRFEDAKGIVVLLRESSARLTRLGPGTLLSVARRFAFGSHDHNGEFRHQCRYRPERSQDRS